MEWNWITVMFLLFYQEVIGKLFPNEIVPISGWLSMMKIIKDEYGEKVVSVNQV